jgi:hypothetical protein
MTKNVVFTFPQPDNSYRGVADINHQRMFRHCKKDISAQADNCACRRDLFEDFEDRPAAWQSNALQTGEINSWTLGDPFKGLQILHRVLTVVHIYPRNQRAA